MILVGIRGDDRVGLNRIDDRLVGWQDVMSTLLDLAGIEIPPTVSGLSMTGNEQRGHLYGECNEDSTATRMIHDGRFKLIYYPIGNRTQLFDLQEDPHELSDLSDVEVHGETRLRLINLLTNELYGTDMVWIRNGELVGLPDQQVEPFENRELLLQRGVHWPPPPVD